MTTDQADHSLAVLHERIGALTEAAARQRKAVLEGGLPEVDEIVPAIDALGREIAHLPLADRQRLLAGFLSLLHEVNLLTRALGRERARFGEQLRAAGSHRRAEVAYRRAGWG